MSNKISLRKYCEALDQLDCKAYGFYGYESFGFVFYGANTPKPYKVIRNLRTNTTTSNLPDESLWLIIEKYCFSKIKEPKPFQDNVSQILESILPRF